VTWEKLLDAAAKDESSEPLRAQLAEKARDVLKEPLVRRIYRYEDTGARGAHLDGRALCLENEIRETFALAMADCSAASVVGNDLPLLATVFRLTGDPALKARILEQLDEVTTWAPIQRPGWTLFRPGARLPADGKDGNWLATGWGVRAIADTIEILPESTVPDELTQRLHALLEKEIASIVEDWRVKRPWFVRGANPLTNQWVLPTEGLVRACLVVGREEHQGAYELGVRNLLTALDSHGESGEFEEGISYATATIASFASAARAMAAAGDHRAVEHRFLSRTPMWLAHHFQPGRMLINTFDSGSAARGQYHALAPLFAALATFMGSETARWALAHQVGDLPVSPVGLVAASLPPFDGAAPPLFAAYQRATRVNWRSSWEDSADGVWVRGGHQTDQHDHQDRGHVNYIVGGEPLLIEAGTPSYDNPRLASHYASGAGHNVLQIGRGQPETPHHNSDWRTPTGWQDRGVVAPVSVERLGLEGGDVTVTIGDGYGGLQQWQRRVEWDARALRVRDEVALAAGHEEFVLFRWHLGTGQEAQIETNGKTATVRWPGATITCRADSGLVVEQTKMPDHTLYADQHDHEHTCIIVSSAQKLGSLSLHTEVVPSR